MNTRSSVLSITNYFKTINGKLLLFLLLFLDVKLVVKIAALVIIYLLQPNFKFRLRLSKTRLPLFYPAAILICILNGLLYGGFLHTNQTAIILTGVSFWLVCLLAVHQLKKFAETTKPTVIYNTIILFFLINACFSFGEIFRIIVETGSINPFRYQGDHQKYFISTGDYIKGVSFDTSVTNAALNAFGIVYFLFYRNYLMVLLCMVVLLLTASNLTNLLLFAVLLFTFFFKANRDQKSIISICFFLLIIFLAKVSPQNNQYLSEIYSKITHQKSKAEKPVRSKLPLQITPDSLLTAEEKKDKIALLYLDSVGKVYAERLKKQNAKTAHPLVIAEARPEMPEPDINTEPYQSRNDTNETRKALISLMEQQHLLLHLRTALPGKAIAVQQMVQFLQQHPSKIWTGNGAGNFSSKLAFKATALGLAGSFPKRLAYINPGFKDNHLALYLTFFSDRAKLHSVINTPNSVYDQILSEYGLLGLAAFIIFYFGYFLKYTSPSNYTLPLMLLMFGFFFTEYWFEQLSIVPFFEFLMFLPKKNLLHE